MKSAHCGEVGSESFAVSCLKLLDEELDVGGDYFFGGLRLGGRGKGSDVAWFRSWWRCCSWVVPPVLNGRAVFANKHALALAHASRGGKCKRRGSLPRNEWRAAAAAGLHKRSAED